MQAGIKRDIILTPSLSKLDRNIIFVGINHSMPSNYVVPMLFDELGKDEIISYSDEIEEIRKYWGSHMSDLNNVIGICYFFYSLNSEAPFYPLKIFWRSDTDKVAINL